MQAKEGARWSFRILAKVGKKQFPREKKSSSSESSESP